MNGNDAKRIPNVRCIKSARVVVYVPIQTRSKRLRSHACVEWMRRREAPVAHVQESERIDGNKPRKERIHETHKRVQVDRIQNTSRMGWCHGRIPHPHGRRRRRTRRTIPSRIHSKLSAWFGSVRSITSTHTWIRFIATRSHPHQARVWFVDVVVLFPSCFEPFVVLFRCIPRNPRWVRRVPRKATAKTPMFMPRV